MPLGVVGAHLSLVVYLSYAVGTSLYTSYKSQSPSQHTRQRLSRRVKLAPVFVGLAAAALSLAAYSTVRYAALSYRAWADHRGYALPQRYVHFNIQEVVSANVTPRWFGDGGLVPDTNNSTELYVAHWLSDTRVYFDAFEIIAEKARRFWWGQQIDLATVAWSMLLAIEGRRRRIPLLPAFMALAHLVNLSYAQNLFYLALLLTPAPIPSGEGSLELPIAPVPAPLWTRLHNAFFPPKPNNWCPHPVVFLAGLAVNIAAIGLLPHAAETPSFVKVVMISRVAAFLPLLLPKVVPVSWGTVHPHPHDAYSSFTTLFRFLSAASFSLHAKATVYGLSYNLPNSHYHRHSRFLPWDVEERSAWERSTTALGKVIGSISDHPVVAAVGWDALICVVSLGVWAAVRATDVQAIIKSAVPYYGTEIAGALPSSQEEASEDKIKTEPEDDESLDPEPYMALKGSGRAKGRMASTASSSDASEDIAASTPRQRRRANRQLTEEEKAYEPTAKEAREVVEGDILPAEELDWESASLSWGLAALGGLGCACAGVFGGESISR